MRSPSPAELGVVRLPRITGLSLYALTALFIALLIWSHLATVDVSVRAQGLVRPEGKVVRMTSEPGGWVESVLKVEGDPLRAGDRLIRLSDTETEAEIEALKEQIALTLERIEDVERRLRLRTEVYRLEARKLAAETESARQDFSRRMAEHEALRHSSSLRIAQARSEHSANQYLLNAGLLSRRDHARSLRDLSLAEAADREIEARRPDDTTLAVLSESAELVHAVFESERRSLEAEAVPLNSELTRLRLALHKSQLTQQQQSVVSPTDGRITFMSPIHVGEYLSPGTLVATIMPSGSRIIVEAFVPNQEVENVRPGQQARLTSDQSVRMNGSVVSVSPDALFDDASTGAYRVVIDPEDGNLRLGTALDVRLITHSESLFSLVFTKITRSLDDWAGS